MTGTLRLENYRNYPSFRAEFNGGINAVIGDNGRGKTNLLEALFFLLQGRSMRNCDMGDMVKDGEEEAVVEGRFDIGREVRIRTVINREGKTQWAGKSEEIRAVVFQPDDIWMVKAGPEVRRRYLDDVTQEARKGYREEMRDYQRVLKQRNEAIRAVRKGVKGREFIRNWNTLLYRHGSSMVLERMRTIREMQREMATLGEAWGKGKIELRYYTSMGEEVADEERTLEKISRMEEAEIRRGVTLTGPHRDELLILTGGRNARRECSQGEQKLVAIMWRLAQARLLKEGASRRTLLLMDDCLSELDETNRQLLMEELRGWEQVVITSTDDMQEFGDARKIMLDRGEPA
ncbi:MAG: DNA replication and repair protein RecF [Actinomycetota bacterium]